MSNHMKMKCKKVKGLLSRFMDGEVSADLRPEIEAHMGICVNCRQELEDLHKAMALLKSVPVPPLPPYLFSRTVARLRAKPSTVRRWQELVWRMAAVLFVAIGIGVGVLLGAGIGGNGGANGSASLAQVEFSELATLNAEPSVEELFGGGR